MSPLRSHWRTLFAWTLVLLAGTLLLTHAFAPEHVLSLTVLPETRGDAFLLQTPAGSTVLINTGPGAGISRQLGMRLPPWQRSLAALVLLTGSTADAGGARTVLTRYHVHTLVRTSERGSAFFERSLIAARLAHPPKEQLRAMAGERIALPGNVFLTFMWPDARIPPSSSYYGAGIVQIQYGSTTIQLGKPASASIGTWIRHHFPQIEKEHVFVLSSSTPPETLISDGRQLWRKD